MAACGGHLAGAQPSPDGVAAPRALTGGGGQRLLLCPHDAPESPLALVLATPLLWREVAPRLVALPLNVHEAGHVA